jgi:hypothetical protein
MTTSEIEKASGDQQSTAVATSEVIRQVDRELPDNLQNVFEMGGTIEDGMNYIRGREDRLFLEVIRRISR